MPVIAPGAGPSAAPDAVPAPAPVEAAAPGPGPAAGGVLAPAPELSPNGAPLASAPGPGTGALLGGSILNIPGTQAALPNVHDLVLGASAFPLSAGWLTGGLLQVHRALTHPQQLQVRTCSPQLLAAQHWLQVSWALVQACCPAAADVSTCHSQLLLLNSTKRCHTACQANVVLCKPQAMGGASTGSTDHASSVGPAAAVPSVSEAPLAGAPVPATVPLAPATAFPTAVRLLPIPCR